VREGSGIALLSDLESFRRGDALVANTRGERRGGD